MSSFTRARLYALLAVLMCVGLLVARPLVRGKFAADVEMTSRGGDPIRLGMHGGVGPEQAYEPGPTRQVIVAGQTNSPFNGPTQAEKAAIDNPRAASHERWTHMLTVMKQNRLGGMQGVEEEERQIRASEPEIHQPLRHLTPYENRRDQRCRRLYSPEPSRPVVVRYDAELSKKVESTPPRLRKRSFILSRRRAALSPIVVRPASQPT